VVKQLRNNIPPRGLEEEELEPPLGRLVYVNDGDILE